MTAASTSPHAGDWPAPGFKIVGDGAETVRAVVETLQNAKRLDQTAMLTRSGPPRLGEAGFSVMIETSGTTGVPKLARHDFARLCGRLRGVANSDGARWLLTYHPCSFAGLQVILTAAAAGAAVIAPRPGADVAELSAAASAFAATHVSGTPSFWRGFLMSSPHPYPDLAAVTLGGEAADQSLLDHLRAAFPAAAIRHIYASTEAGALFAVADGREGFPVGWLESGVDGVGLQINDGELLVNSPRAMLAGTEWLATGDLAEIRGDRVVFTGRKDGRVNVGGVKVSPEEAEARILAVEGVADALVAAVANPITGYLLTATIVPRPNADVESLRRAAREATADLPPAGRPRIIVFADALPLSPSGKKSRIAS